tara:strand:+ start:367 stop:684 length:318 start_codon:yes stop_codon:yes gene_type:complete
MGTYTSSEAQIRMVKIDTDNESVTIKNLGTSTVDISGYWMCSLFNYQSLGSITPIHGNYNFGQNEEVEISATSINLNDTSADVGLYSSSSFSSSAAIVDFFQYRS